MHICIDCSPLLMRSGGVKTYIHRLVGELQASHGNEQVAAFPFLSRIPKLDHQRSAAGDAGTYLRIAGLVALNRGLLPSRWVAPKADLFHASNQVRRVPGARRLTATLHDMTSWLMPQFHTPDTLRADREFADRILRRADGIIAVSHKSKQDAVEILRLPPERIHVIQHGVEQSYFEASAAGIALAQTAHSLERPYILFVSMIEPRKNLDRLITAYERLAADLREEYELIVAGPKGWNSDRTIQRLASGIRGVRYLGYVPEELMPGLMAGAAVFAYPSMYEGFGLPVLQAMAAGVPVIASNAGSLPEVAGEPAVYVDPQSEDEIVSALSRLLSSPTERMRRSETGRAHAATYRWSKCAQQSWAFFERVTSGPVP